MDKNGHVFLSFLSLYRLFSGGKLFLLLCHHILAIAWGFNDAFGIREISDLRNTLAVHLSKAANLIIIPNP